jgi:hypothetical protein
MGFLRVLGWVFVPYVMIFIRWKTVGMPVKIIGGIWAGLILIMTITIATSDGTKKGYEAGAVDALNDTTKATSEVSDAVKTPEPTKSPKPTVAPTKPPEPTVTPVVVQESASESSSQRNAVRTAKDYLDYAAFSRQGLIKQLAFDKYPDADAEYAVDQIGADWNEQAAKTAIAYLDYSAFSKQELIKQLEFDGYTSEQAIYGVDKSYK